MSSQGQKVAVVTGASQGIGAGLISAFRKIGYATLATSRTIADSADAEIAVVRGDISERTTAELVVTTAVERFGRIDTLVNNAGIFVAKAFTDYTEEDFSTVSGVNLDGFFHTTQLVIPYMLSQGSGHIINITSSLVDNANSSVPSVLASLTKGGLQSATKSLAIEYAAEGIRVNAVSPGIIKTPMHPKESHDALGALLPVGRMGEERDVVDAVMYLEDASFVTGEILHVDGGQSAGR
jgi:NAD(P)-dependent dehydrogenase (short-subunit alcohol dehydrogenase family)